MGVTAPGAGRLATAALLLLAAGCEAEIPSCPGAVQGTMTLAGAADAGTTTCAFAVAASFDLPVSVTFLDASTAAVCVQRPLAVVRSGPRDALDPDRFSVEYTLPLVTIATCPCPVDLRETLAGTLVRSAGSSSVGFDGTLVDHFTRSATDAAAACFAAADPSALAGCPAAPDPVATPPVVGGCDAGYLVTAAAGP